MGVQGGVLDIDDQQVEPAQPRVQARRGDRTDWAGIAEHEPDPRRRQPRINRQIRRPRLEHPHHRHHRPRRALHQQRHHTPGTHAMVNQQVRQPISGLLHLPVGHAPAPETDRHRLRGARHLRSK
jgi:hypothetical protein